MTWGRVWGTWASKSGVSTVRYGSPVGVAVSKMWALAKRTPFPDQSSKKGMKYVAGLHSKRFKYLGFYEVWLGLLDAGGEVGMTPRGNLALAVKVEAEKIC